MVRKPDIAPSEVVFRLKGKYLGQNGQPQGVLARHFVISRENLFLGDVGWVPLERVARCDVIGGRLGLAVSRPEGNDAYGIKVAGLGAAATASEFKKKLDQARSVRILALKRAALAAQGREGELKVELCPCCRTPVDLTRFEDCRQIFCPFCGRISTLGDQGANEIEREHEFCDSCGFFARVREYATIRLLFLIYFSSWQKRREKLCPACARRGARNRAIYCFFLSTVLAPFTVFYNMLAYFRALFAERGMPGGMFGELGRANRLAAKGRLDEAIALYAEMSKAAPHAGVLTNMVTALLRKGELETAAKALEQAIALCPNYLPNHELLANVLAKLGREEESKKVVEHARYLWEVDESAQGGAKEAAGQEGN